MNRSKPIDQYSLTGELLKTWPSICAASRELGIARDQLTYAVLGAKPNSRTTDPRYKGAVHSKRNTHSSHGFVWRPRGEPFERTAHLPVRDRGRKKIPVTLSKDGQSFNFPHIKAANQWVAQQRGVRTANLLATTYGYEITKHVH